MPVVMFLTSSFYKNTPGFPPLGLQAPIYGNLTISSLLYPLAWTIYLTIILIYIGFQIKLWKAGSVLNGSKLLYMLSIIPLHFVAFSHPIMAIFIVPLVTVGHNIQYHCIVYSFAQNKYKSKTSREFKWAKALFKNFTIYALVGLVFTFGFYKGPWIDWLKSVSGLELDTVLLNSIGMMAGIKDPASLRLKVKLL